MKKTLSINLNGCVFNIDEDAYEKLNQYLSELGTHFAVDEKEEIMKDIEARIAELFAERTQMRNVVEITDVEEVISILGQPSQFEDETGAQSSNTTSEANVHHEQPKGKRVSRKLYRDTANKRIGGVAAGLAAYMDWDVTLVRILCLLVLLFSLGWTIFIYLLLWIFIPEASSVAQRLEMQGIDPTVENISNYSEKYGNITEKSPNGLTKAIKIIAMVILGIIGLSLLAGVLGIFIAMITMMFHLLPFFGGPFEYLTLGSVALFLLCPAIAIIMFCRYLLSANKPRNRWTAWVLLGLWLVSIVGVCVFGVKAVEHHRDNCHNLDEKRVETRINDVSLDSQIRDGKKFTEIEVEDGMTVEFSQGDSVSIEVSGNANKLNQVTTDVQNGVLTVSNIGKQSDRDKLVVKVTAPTLTKVSVSDAGYFVSTQDLDLDKVKVELDDAASIKLRGKCNQLTIHADDASSVEMKNFNAHKAMIKASGASDVEIGEVEDLQIQCNDASKVNYQGTPRRLYQSSSSSFSFMEKSM